MHDRETSHRSRTESQEREADDQCGQVRVQNRAPGALETKVDCLLWGQACPKFLTYSLVDQYVGVNSHAEGQCDGGNAGQSQGGLQHGEHGQQQ